MTEKEHGGHNNKSLELFAVNKMLPVQRGDSDLPDGRSCLLARLPGAEWR